MVVALPGTDAFDEERVEQRAADRARRRPRQVSIGLVSIAGGLAAAFVYAWTGVHPGQGAMDLGTSGGLRWLPGSTLIVAPVASALVVVGTRLAVAPDARRLSRTWIATVLTVVVLATTFAGSMVLLPAKWARSAHPAAAADRELARKTFPAPYCTAPMDPAAFTDWVDDPQVCGWMAAGHRVLFIGGADPTGDPSLVRGLVYSPDQVPGFEEVCVRRIDDAWWQYAAHIDGRCPEGLVAAPGG